MIPAGQIAGKAELFLEFESRLAIFDTLVLCRFYRDFHTWERLVGILHRVTGLDAGEQVLKGRALEIADLTRRFNIREG
jgi:aldehyde:ferredoxin oxidoreductase